MRFVSTRGGIAPCSFADALVMGFADDNGLVLPEHIPSISPQIIQEWRALSYSDLCFAVFRQFVDESEIPSVDLKDLMERAYSRFALKDVVRLSEMSDPKAKELAGYPAFFLEELWHGPTLAFKDMPLQITAQLLQYFLLKQQKKITVLVSTSGDTGSAAIESVRGLSQIDIIVLYPGEGRISRSQELQMITVCDDNVRVVYCEGTSDDNDVPLRQVSNDLEFKRKYSLSSMNSVNIGRILGQIVHFLWGLFRANEGKPELLPADFSCPTGAAGHATAGVIAKLMGFPIGNILLSVNDNDILLRLLRDGVLKATEALATNSPAIDIQSPYNVERLLYYASNSDPEVTKRWMEVWEKDGQLTLNTEENLWLQSRLGLYATHVSPQEVLDTIALMWGSFHFLVDPHTAVGVKGAFNSGQLESFSKAPIMVVMSTAHASKFSKTVASALKLSEEEVGKIIYCTPPDHKYVQQMTKLESLPRNPRWTVFKRGDNWTERLKELIMSFKKL